MKTKKLRKQCKRLAYRVQQLELEQRLAELQDSTDRKQFGFSVGRKGKSHDH